MFKSVVLLVCIAPLVAACSGSTGSGGSGTVVGTSGVGSTADPASTVSVVKNEDGSISVTNGDRVVTIDPEDINYNAHGEGRHFGHDSERRGFAIHETESYIVAAGVSEGGGFGGITADDTALPSADATYDVAYDLARQNTVGAGNMQLTYDFNDNRLTGQDDRLDIDATAAADGTFSGTVDVTWGPINETGSVTGGFVGDGIAGAMAGDNFGGVFSGNRVVEP